MSRCGWVPNPIPGAIQSSFITRSDRNPIRERVVVIAEREGMIRVQPAVVEMARDRLERKTRIGLDLTLSSCPIPSPSSPRFHSNFVRHTN